MDTSMANYILSIFKTNLPIVWSWGFHNARAIDNGLEFLVQGFVFSGLVRVVYDYGTDTFNVYLEKNGKTVREEKDVYLDCLVNVIDGMVEKDCSQSEYTKKVNAAYGM